MNMHAASGKEEKVVYHPKWEKDGYTLRPAVAEDAQAYYERGFCPLDAETARLTGSKTHYTRQEVVDFFLRCRSQEDRQDFLLIDPLGKIVGEAVLNEMDDHLRCANFRVALFDRELFGKGLGTWMTEKTLEFAFEEAKLHRVSLEVFAFNPRAIHVYEKVGFRREGVLKDAVLDGDRYADSILMAILEDQWCERK